MTEAHDDHPPLDASLMLIEATLRGGVECGAVEIAGKSADEVADQVVKYMTDAGLGADGDVAFQVMNDYQETLLSKARAEVGAGHNELAITLYATWIEHFVNRALSNALMRMGHGPGVATPLIRELRLATKITALWRIVGLPEISDTDRRLLSQIAEFRNAFVHYKWTSYTRQEHVQRDQKLSNVTAQCEQLMSSLTALEDSALWDGREQEIVQYMREGIRDNWIARWGEGDGPE